MTDLQLKKHVLNELEWEPSLHAEEIGVAVKNGIVTLTGTVSTFGEKLAAERATKRVRGVRGFADKIEVKLATSTRRSDADIARAAADALCWNTDVPTERITLHVEDGWLTLEGEVDWAYQRDAAMRSVRYLSGVRGVTDLVQIKAKLDAGEIKRRLAAAFQRNAEVEAKNIQVEAKNGRVVLTGKVHSWPEHDEATRVAWSAPGVVMVEDRLTVAA
jgi:osmotically-inducible protein OsmY